MKTRQITIDGVEYTISSSTNLGLENAIIQLKNSLNQEEVSKPKKKNKKEDAI